MFEMTFKQFQHIRILNIFNNFVYWIVIYKWQIVIQSQIMNVVHKYMVAIATKSDPQQQQNLSNIQVFTNFFFSNCWFLISRISYYSEVSSVKKNHSLNGPFLICWTTWHTTDVGQFKEWLFYRDSCYDWMIFHQTRIKPKLFLIIRHCFISITYLYLFTIREFVIKIREHCNLYKQKREMWCASK